MSNQTLFIELLKGEKSEVFKNVLFFLNSSPERQNSNRLYPNEYWKTHVVPGLDGGTVREYAISSYGRAKNLKFDKFLTFDYDETRTTKDYFTMRMSSALLGGKLDSIMLDNVMRVYFPELMHDPDDMYAEESEEWRLIEGDYIKNYYISNYGRVKTTTQGSWGWYYLKSDRLSPDGETKLTSRACLRRNNGRKPRQSIHKLLSENFPEALIESMRSSLSSFKRYEQEYWLDITEYKGAEKGMYWISSHGREVFFNIDPYTKVFSKYRIKKLKKEVAQEILLDNKERILQNEMLKIEQVVQGIVENAYEVAINRTPRKMRLEMKRVASNKRNGMYEVYDRRRKKSRYYQAMDELAEAENISEEIAKELLLGMRLEYRGIKIYYRGERIRL